MIKDDGTARGFTQILLTYTLSAITALLGFSTLWLSCGTLARDIEECQMQVVVTKPIARWQIWLGKWIGILSLNAVLLALSGGCVFGLLQWRATKLPAKEQEVLHNEVLVARGSVKPDNNEEKIQSDAREILQERLKHTPVTQADLPEVQKQIVEQVKAEYQIVPPGYTKTWEINFGTKAKSARTQPLQLRIKFNSAAKSASGTFDAYWRIGVPQKTKIWGNTEPMSLAPDTFHEFAVDPDLLDQNGVLTISFANLNDTALLFPLDDGMEVLYREGSFGLNFARGLAIIFCWMALLAAIGLASASFLSFPVAAFLSLGILAVALIFRHAGTNVVSEGSIDSSATGRDQVGRYNFGLGDCAGFSGDVEHHQPGEEFFSNRFVEHRANHHLGATCARVCANRLVAGRGVFAVFGIFVFNRRELATAQNQ